MEYVTREDPKEEARYQITASNLTQADVLTIQKALNTVWFPEPTVPKPAPGSTTGTYTVAMAQMNEFILRAWDQNRIYGIKLVRTITGWNLRDAKLYCDQLAVNRTHMQRLENVYARPGEVNF